MNKIVFFGYGEGILKKLIYIINHKNENNGYDCYLYNLT